MDVCAWTLCDKRQGMDDNVGWCWCHAQVCINFPDAAWDHGGLCRLLDDRAAEEEAAPAPLDGDHLDHGWRGHGWCIKVSILHKTCRLIFGLITAFAGT